MGIEGEGGPGDAGEGDQISPGRPWARGKQQVGWMARDTVGWVPHPFSLAAGKHPVKSYVHLGSKGVCQLQSDCDDP